MKARKQFPNLSTMRWIRTGGRRLHADFNWWSDESVGKPLLRRRLARESPPQSFHLATQDGRSPQTGIWFDFSRPHYKDIISSAAREAKREREKSIRQIGRVAGSGASHHDISVCLLTRPWLMRGDTFLSLSPAGQMMIGAWWIHHHQSFRAPIEGGGREAGRRHTNHAVGQIYSNANCLSLLSSPWAARWRSVLTFLEAIKPTYRRLHGTRGRRQTMRARCSVALHRLRGTRAMEMSKNVVVWMPCRPYWLRKKGACRKRRSEWARIAGKLPPNELTTTTATARTRRTKTEEEWPM